VITDQSAFINWLFSEDDSGQIKMLKAYEDWNKEDSLLEFTQEQFKKRSDSMDEAYQEEMRRS